MGQRWPNRNFFLLCLSVYLLSYQFTLCFGIRMISTTTKSPEGLTTPKNSADNKAATKAAVEDFVNLATSMENLKYANNVLSNSSLVRKVEKELAEIQTITHTVERYYKFKWTHHASKICSIDYAKEKANLLREFSALLKDCKEALDNLDVLRFSSTDKQYKLILHGCSERAKTIPVDVATLMDHTYPISYLCALESVQMVLEELRTSRFLDRIDENSMLLLQELDYLLKTYETIMENVHPEVNQIDSHVWNFIKEYKCKLAAVKGVAEANVTKNAIRTFTNTVQRLFNQNHTSNTSISKEPYIVKISRSLKEIVFAKHIKIPQLIDDSIDNWAKSPGLYKIILMNNLLKEMMTTVTLKIPHSIQLHMKQKDWSKAKLYTEISSTFGKPCENNPNHLVGTCTEENHEICRHAVQNLGADDDQQLLSNQELIHIENLQLKHCRCGFLTNCEKAENSARVTCFLIPNSNGQCRGGEGYPCRTHPLENGGYDESCASGYCNREKDACEANGSTGIDWEKVKEIKKVATEKVEQLVSLLR